MNAPILTRPFTIDDFLLLCVGEQSLRVLTASLAEEGFTTLYVRYTRHIIDRKTRGPMLDIANVTVTKKGEGTFTRLVERIHARYPHLPIHVENVTAPRFRRHLLKLGFREVNNDCFFLEPQSETIHPFTAQDTAQEPPP